MSIPIAAILLIWLVLSAWHSIDLLQFFQQHEYLSGRFFHWSITRWRRVINPLEALALVGILFGLVEPGMAVYAVGLALGLWLAAAAVGFAGWRRERVKVIKPLVYTARVKRLLASAGLVGAAEALLTYWATASGRVAPGGFLPVLDGRLLVFIACLWALEQLTFLNLILANGLAFPVEEFMRQRYIAEARRIIREVNPIVIGITGSYGKTSTKEILAHLLGAKVEVLKTPKTFNTILGVCKVIRDDLKPQHRYFIVEMGAYKPGEIARICRLVHPKIGILTAVGPQHLERFGSIENIARAKYELIEALPGDGVAIFNGDDPICRELAAKTKIRTLRYGMLPDSADLDLRGLHPQTSEQGTSFEIQYGAQLAEPARTRLLGRHNITNCLGAILAALECQLTLKEAAHALASLQPLEHRLQVVRAQGGITTIDNAYNSNPSGARVALEVLASFQNGRKVLVTPGFAELGPIQAQEHANLGRSAAQVCDYIFLIGETGRTDEILAGIRETSFDAARVYCYNRLNDARPQLRELLKPGDVVLFENDLTDIY
ncbi:MAG TPA: UDP-N-acetylmuramoyl-tripeptide--D-alanyl-D-alanine ligase [Anaerolineaceae bacterium]